MLWNQLCKYWIHRAFGNVEPGSHFDIWNIPFVLFNQSNVFKMSFFRIGFTTKNILPSSSPSPSSPVPSKSSPPSWQCSPPRKRTFGPCTSKRAFGPCYNQKYLAIITVTLFTFSNKILTTTMTMFSFRWRTLGPYILYDHINLSIITVTYFPVPSKSSVIWWQCSLFTL